MDRTAEDPDVELLDKMTPYRGFFQIDTFRLRHKKFDGGWTEPQTREVFERGHAAGVLLYDPEQDNVVLIEQFRIGAYAAGQKAWLLEVVAGIIEPQESAEAVVRRESLEEAGCEITDILPLGNFIMTPGGSSEIISLFCGRVDSTGAGGFYGLTEEGEDIRAFVLSREEVLAKLSRGEINNALAVIALQWLALNHQTLKSRWRKL